VKKRAADARRERRRFWGIRGSFAGDDGSNSRA
jgi:hypothetical protein